MSFPWRLFLGVARFASSVNRVTVWWYFSPIKRAFFVRVFRNRFRTITLILPRGVLRDKPREHQGSFLSLWLCNELHFLMPVSIETERDRRLGSPKIALLLTESVISNNPARKNKKYFKPYNIFELKFGANILVVYTYTSASFFT